jgi:spore germination protein KB
VNNQKISASQFFGLIVLFELGSAIVIGVGLDAKQDVWLVIVIGTIAGILLFFVYEYLSKMYVGLTLVGILRATLGRFFGNILSIVYICYFTYIATRILRDFADQIIMIILHGTPLVAVIMMFLVALIIGCYLGIEVIGRMCEIYFPWIIGFGGLMLSFIYIAGLPEMNKLQPMFPKGLTPVLQATFPEVVTFPFGEVIVFLMLIPCLNKPEMAKKAGYFAIITSGLILLIINMTIVAVLGGDGATRADLPLVEALARVNIANFIQRLDALAIITLMLCGYFKIIVFMYAAVSGLTEITGGKFKYNLAIPIGLIILIWSLVVSENTVEHIYVGVKVVPKYIHLPLQIVIPVLLVLFVFILNKTKNQYNHTVEK